MVRCYSHGFLFALLAKRPPGDSEGRRCLRKPEQKPLSRSTRCLGRDCLQTNQKLLPEPQARSALVLQQVLSGASPTLPLARDPCKHSGTGMNPRAGYRHGVEMDELESSVEFTGTVHPKQPEQPHTIIHARETPVQAHAYELIQTHTSTQARRARARTHPRARTNESYCE